MLLPDWINFRCGVCPGLLHRLCCDFEPRAQTPPPTPPNASSPFPPSRHFSSAPVPPFSSFTPPRRLALPARHPPTHTQNCHVRIHTRTYASAHASKQSYPMCLLHSDGMPEESLSSIHIPLSFLFSFSEH